MTKIPVLRKTVERCANYVELLYDNDSQRTQATFSKWKLSFTCDVLYWYVEFIYMDTKLTLKLNSSVIENAKSYAKSKNISLSQLVETYLHLLTNPKSQEAITPLVKSLSGVIKLPKAYGYRKEYKKHLSDKYCK